ncbi:MAG TPA: hypothetical protein VFS44_11045 [Gemmatimonadaceae bacterium]|nr:hypothetical protein [Gemmatimonadaceae bacterium]
MSSRIVAALLVAGLAAIVVPRRASAQEAPHCRIVCRPTFSVGLGGLTSHLFDQPRVAKASGGVARLPTKTNLYARFLVVAPTALPRTSLVFSASWLPTAKTAANPFTEYTASELGDQTLHANTPSLTLGAAVDLVRAKQTRNLFGLAAYLNDLYSPAARPSDRSSYTHKLDLGLSSSIAVFDWTPPQTYLHQSKAFLILDWTATGLPHRGDEVPAGERTFLETVRPWSLIYGISFPIASGK